MSEELSSQEMADSVISETGQAPSGAPAATQSANWWEPHLKSEVEYAIEGGKNIKEPMETILKRAGMGYHYAQKMHQIKQQMEHYKSLEERNKSLSRWEEYDKFASENPQWAKHVEDSWNSRANLQQLNQTQSQSIPPEFLKRFEALEAWQKEAVQREAQAKAGLEDKSFAEEISGVSKTFGVDLSQADEHGRSLEWRILEHMTEMGLDGTKPGHFRAAFKDYYWDNLLAREKEKTREDHVKEQSELKKAGIKSISRSPKADGLNGGYRPGMSWNDLGNAALADLKANMKF